MCVCVCVCVNSRDLLDVKYISKSILNFCILIGENGLFFGLSLEDGIRKEYYLQSTIYC